jgi:hypothetical protein
MTAQIHMLKCPEHGEIPCPVCVAALYGKQGGAAAVRSMTAKQRKERATKAAKSRWNPKKKKPK